MMSPKFLSITRQNIHLYFPKILLLYIRYRKFLGDDFSKNQFGINYIYTFILERSPLFWVILADESYAGFIYLDELIGSKDYIHCAELTVCLDKKFWGQFTRKVADEFISLCFENLNLHKLKACIYPENNRVRSILNYCGFEKEGFFKSETIKNAIPQDVEIYGLLNKNINCK